MLHIGMNAQRSSIFLCSACLIAGLVMLLCGWLMPAHLKAVDAAVLQAADRQRPTDLIRHPAPSGLPGLDPATNPVAAFLIRAENREKALALLEASPLPAVRELLRCRALTNTVLFHTSSSASGHAFDTAVALCGLLLEGGHLQPGLAAAILDRARTANHRENSAPIEEILMDELSLGQRFDWRHLLTFMGGIDDPRTLTDLADSVRNAGERLPVLYAAVEMSQRPSAVAHYLSKYSQTGLQDLVRSERFGAGGVNELLKRDQRLYVSSLRQRLAGRAPFNGWFRTAAGYALQTPRRALALKWLFYFSGGFFIAVALRLVWPQAPQGTGPRPARGSVLAREILFASGVLLAALLLSEPFLAQENQKGGAPFRLRLPSVGGPATSQTTRAIPSIMNTPNMTMSLLTLLLFFILQALIYAACLARLAETLRQNVPARVKLKLLENEDHLFDAGLYLGFVGTIICLILVSLGVLQFSLMASYSSTSFGIIFVSILKIFNVRPARRRLLLQAEEDLAPAEEPAPMSAHTFVTAP